jgi:hypothetical protein
MDWNALLNSPFLVGAAGAFVSLRFSPDDSWRLHLFNLLCGALIAGYGAQPTADWLRLAKESDMLGVAFVMGLLGLSIIAAARKAISELKLAEIVTSWISRRG